MGTRLTLLLWPLRMVERVARRVGRRLFPNEGGQDSPSGGANPFVPPIPPSPPPGADIPTYIPPTEGDMSDRITMGQLTLRERLEAKDDIVLLDVREPHEVDQGQIPGAVPLPLASISSRFQELDPGHTIVAYCATGRRSAEAAMALKELGFPKVHSLAGGFSRWVRDGGEVLRPGVSSGETQ